MSFQINGKNGGGFSFSGGFITLILVILKLTGVIKWRWIFVFLPLEITAAILIIMLIIIIRYKNKD